MKNVSIFVILLMIIFTIGCWAFGLIMRIDIYGEDLDSYDQPAGIRTEKVECPVNIVDIHFSYLPADLSGLDSFQKDAARLAQVIYGEARGLRVYDKSMVAWCVLNRLDLGLWGNDIYSVISSPSQFNWKNNFPVTEEDYQIAADVLMRYEMEQCVLGDIGRTLPKQFVNFRGNGKENIFKDRQGNVYSRWLRDPYQ